MSVKHISEHEERQLLIDFNDTKVEYPIGRTIIDLFEDQVSKTPKEVAVIDDSGSALQHDSGIGLVGLFGNMTYGELHAISGRLSYYLLNRSGIKPGDVVGVKLERSRFLILSILGILKSGGVYLPIDKGLPEKRIRYIQEDSGLKLIIDEGFLEEFIKTKMDDFDPSARNSSSGSGIAYIIYTSGTTGLPKGTLIEHHSLVNRLCWMKKRYSLSADDVILQKTTCSFDVSVWELLLWSISGAKVVFLKDGYEKDPAEIIQFIERFSVTIIHFVPSMLMQFLEYIGNDHESVARLTSLKMVFVSGEPLTVRINKEFHDVFKDCRLINLYGPTEATIDVTYFDCKMGLERIPIGKPIDNTRIYILDTEYKLVPIEVQGRIFLAGAGLARGYLNKPDLTAQKFIQSPLRGGERLYDTGDIGRWLADGNIEFCGRDDEQVKINGHRIELGEIGRTMEKLSGIVTAHVLKIGDKLVAFVSSDINGQDKEEDDLKNHLRSGLSESLPDYMIPNHFCFIKEFPLSSSGKVDKKSLGDIFEDRRNSGKKAGTFKTQTVKSREMAEIWSEVLEISANEIDPDKSFIEQGGDSMTMLKVVARCKRRGYAVTIKEFMNAPYLDFLENSGKSLKNERNDKNEGHEKIEEIQIGREDEAFALSPIQQYFFDNNPGLLNYIMHASYFIHKEFDAKMVEGCLDRLILDHDSFRLRFKKVRGFWHQRYGQDTTSYVLDVADREEGKVELSQCIIRATQIINIESGPLLYARIFYENAKPVIFIACHHLVMDVVSWQILVNDLQMNYRLPA